MPANIILKEITPRINTNSERTKQITKNANPNISLDTTKEVIFLINIKEFFI
jgi:hypothetical protein